MHDMNNDIAKVLISEERLRGVHGRFDARHHGTLQH